MNISDFQSVVLKKEGLYASYVSPESHAYQQGFKDPDGNWTAIYVNAYLMGYNTNLLSRKDIPDSYEGFLDPRWRGKKIGFDTKEVQFFANMLKIWAKKRAWSFSGNWSPNNCTTDKAIP